MLVGFREKLSFPMYTRWGKKYIYSCENAKHKISKAIVTVVAYMSVSIQATGAFLLRYPVFIPTPPSSFLSPSLLKYFSL